jgi:hypothetical protein
LAYQASTCPLLLPPAKRAPRSLSLLFSLSGPPSCSSHKLRQFQLAPHSGPPCGARVSSAVRPLREGIFRFCQIYEILRVLRPRFPRRGHLVHRYYQKISCLRYFYLYISMIPDHEDPGRASGFHSHHHLEGNSSCSAIRTRSPYHGEGKVTLLFLLKKLTERVRVIGSSDPAAFMSRSFNCPSETRSRSAMHGRPPSFLYLGPTRPRVKKKWIKKGTYATGYAPHDL